MSEETYQVESTRYEYRCDHCKKGFMEYTGVFSGTSLLKITYEHKCYHCNNMTMLSKMYPNIKESVI